MPMYLTNQNNQEHLAKDECDSESLFLAKKNISVFPDQLLERCNFIKFCYLEGNCLSGLPESFFKSLTCCKWLDLRHNNLETLPTDGLIGHSSLETILLQNNRIKILPYHLAFVPQLRGVQVAGNPIENVPYEIITGGFHILIRYLRKLSQALLPVSETTIKNPCQESTTSMDRSHSDKLTTMGTNLSVKKPNDSQQNMMEAFNIKSYKNSTEAVVDAGKINSKKKSSKILRSLTAVKICSNQITSYCKSAQNRKKMRNSQAYDLVTQEKIEANFEKSRQRAKLKETIKKQSQMIQRLKDLQTIKSWRKTNRKANDCAIMNNYQNMSMRSNLTDTTPFDLDPDMMKMLSRKDIYMSLKQWEQKKRKEAEKHLKTCQSKIRGTEDQINDLAVKLKELELTMQKDMEIVLKKESLSHRIDQINKLRRELLKVGYMGKM